MVCPRAFGATGSTNVFQGEASKDVDMRRSQELP